MCTGLDKQNKNFECKIVNIFFPIIFIPPTKSEGYSFGVVRASFRPSVHSVRPSVRPSVHTFCLSGTIISVPIGQIWFILGTNDKYYELSISYKFGQNRPLNTWVIALV